MLNKKIELSLTSFILSVSLSHASSHFTAQEASDAFEAAWNNPHHTAFQMDPVELNTTFEAMGMNLRTTKSELWNIEVAKTSHPDVYIPHVVSTAEAQPILKLSPDLSFVIRTSWQRSWLNPDVYTQVREEAYIFHNEQRILFFGREFDASHTPCQLLFHVEHAAGGTEENPLNMWRIVHLTPSYDLELAAVMKRLNDNFLPVLKMVAIHRAQMNTSQEEK